MQQKQHGAVGHARQAGAEAPGKALGLVLAAHFLLDLLPFHAEGRVGEHVVEVPAGVAVVAEGVAEHDVGHVLALDEHVGLADGVGLGVELLPVDGQAGLGVVLVQVFAGHAEHAARAGRGVVQGAHHAGFGQHGVVLDEQQVHHQADDFARGEVLAGGFVGQLGELADQLLEHGAHIGVADHARVQVDLAELFGHLIEQAGPGQALDLGLKFEVLEDVAHFG